MQKNLASVPVTVSVLLLLLFLSPAALAQNSIDALISGKLSAASDEEGGQDAEALRQAAEQGDAKAQHDLAIALVTGRGVKADVPQAVDWIRKSAQQGYAPAQCDLARLYQEGQLGVATDHEQAVKWFRKAADQNYAKAQLGLSTMYARGLGVSQSDEETIKWTRRAADQGYLEAQFFIGEFHAAGAFGVPKDPYMALGKYTLACNDGVAGGIAEACMRIFAGKMSGEVGPKDIDMAVKYVGYAARLGHPVGQIEYGAAIDQGRVPGVPKKDAGEWFLKAAKQGDTRAQNFVSGCYFKGKCGFNKDDREAVEWLKKSARQGWAESMRDLGIAYERGIGVETDVSEAAKWYKKAALVMTEGAAELLEQLEKKHGKQLQ